MRRLLAIAALVALAGFGLVAPAGAQQFGVHANWADRYDFGIGARVQTGIGGMLGFSGDEPLASLEGILEADYYLWDCAEDCSYVEFNGNAVYPFEVGEEAGGVQPYAGGGVNVAYQSYGNVDPTSDLDIGLNILAGARFDLEGIGAFGEVKQELGGGRQFVVMFGILIGGGSD